MTTSEIPRAPGFAAPVLGYTVRLVDGNITSVCEHCLSTNREAQSNVAVMIALITEHNWRDFREKTCWWCALRPVSWVPVDPVMRCLACSGTDGVHTVLRCTGQFALYTMDPAKEHLIHQERAEALARLATIHMRAVFSGQKEASVSKRDVELAKHVCLCVTCARERGEVKH